jgi:hypothetical protein
MYLYSNESLFLQTFIIAFFIIKVIMFFRNRLVKSQELIWVSFQLGRISGYFHYPVSGRIPDIKKGGLSGRLSGAFNSISNMLSTLLTYGTGKIWSPQTAPYAI